MANDKRTLVEVSPYGVQLLSVSGRTVTGWIGKGADAKEAVAEFVQAAEGVPFALLAPRRHAAARGEGDADAALAGLAGALEVATGGVTGVVVDAATGRAPGGGAWLAVGAPREQAEESSQALAALGVVAPSGGLALAAHIGAVAACLQVSGGGERVVIWAPGELFSTLTLVSATGVEKSLVVQLGQAQVYEAVQLALGLKFKSAAQKLFANEGYDFSAAAAKVGAKLAESLAAPISELGGGAALHVVGLSSAQSAWLTPALAEALGIAAWVPDFAAWISSKGWTVAGDVTLSAAAAGVVGAALQPDVWIVASPAKVAAPVAAASVTAAAAAEAKQAAPAPAPAKQPVSPKPVQAKAEAAAPATKPAVQPKPAAKPVPVAKAPAPQTPPVAAQPAPTAAPAAPAKAPSAVGGIPLSYIISGVAVALLVGAGFFLFKGKEEPKAAQVASSAASSPAGTPPASTAKPDKPASSLDNLLATPPVPGLAKQNTDVAPTPAPVAPAPATTPASSRPVAPASTPPRPAPAVANPVVDSPNTAGMTPATDFVARGESSFKNDLYEIGLFDGNNLIVVRQKGRVVLSQNYYQTTQAVPGPNAKPLWKQLDKFQIYHGRVARLEIPNGVRFVITQENSRARADHEIVCLPDRINIKSSMTPKDYVSGVEGRVFTYADWSWAPDMMPGTKLKNDSSRVYANYNDGSVVGVVFMPSFSMLLTDEATKTRLGASANLSGTSQTRVQFIGMDSKTYGPLEMSVRFE